MERSPKRSPSGGSRFSYDSGSENRTVPARNNRYGSDRGGRGYSRSSDAYGRRETGFETYSGNRDSRGYQGGNGRERNGENYRDLRYSDARNRAYAGNVSYGGHGVQILDFFWKYRFFLFLTAAALLLTLVIVLIIGPRTSKAVELPYYTPAPSVAATPVSILEETAPAATEVPQATATPVPTPRPTMVAEYQVFTDKSNTDKALGLVESARVDDSYFNDTVFVGDSVSKKLEYYIAAERKKNPTLLGDAKFLTAQSFSARNALRDVTDSSIHPTYQGTKMKLEDAIAAINPKRVYIMLGMNDVGVTGVDTAVENMIELLKLIKQKSPNVQIFVQSATPRVSGSRPTTEQLFEYNVKLYEYCKYLTDYDIWFVDVAYVMRDAEGKLYEEYCSDLDSMALHFTNEGCRVWVDYLYTHALADN